VVSPGQPRELVAQTRVRLAADEASHKLRSWDPTSAVAYERYERGLSDLFKDL
jgi:hypothetical protein